MYVLCDIEWATNDQEHMCLTQISATRVNEQWESLDSFDSLIRPQNASFEDWKQVCYTGAQSKDFKYAPTSYTVLSEFEKWLLEDDIVLWWYEASHETYEKLHKVIFKSEPPFKHLALLEYVSSYIMDGHIRHSNPYRLAKARNIATPQQQHVSKNDVIAMQRLLIGIKYPQDLLLEPPRPVAENGGYTAQEYPYQYDEKDGLLHKRGCPAIPEGHRLSGHTKLNKLIRKKFRPCPQCMVEEMRNAKREMNREMLARTQYIYVYSTTSQIFHRYDCSLILSADEIQGSGYYKTAINTGRVPCKVCNPTEDDELHPRFSPRLLKAKSKKLSKRSLGLHEQRALARHTRASAERKEALASGFSTEEEKRDMYVLTQPEFSFWAGQGYSNFHLRHCPKLSGITNLKGFKYYSAAKKAGFIPCKYCKPTPKHDTAISIPIYNQVRNDETLDDLIRLCDSQGYYSLYNGSLFVIETPVGHWKLNVQIRPIQVDHKNIAMEGANASYHRQPREFLSLSDAFRYIDRHDKNLIAKQNHQPYDADEDDLN